MLTFLPLGGAGEIGMNMNAYATGGRWLLVDCGIGFEHVAPGRVEVFLPDPAAVAGHPEAIDGLVLTHVHLDHLGAVAALWPRLRCPVHLTPFAAAVLRPRLRDAGLEGRVPLVEHVPGSRWSVGPFELEAVTLTHSTVEMVGLGLRAGGTSVFHTGDFKLDDRPGTGPRSDLARLRALGDAGVDVVVSDSTNATRPGWSRSEGAVAEHLHDLVAARTGRVAVGVFSSNVARIEALSRVATACGRHPVLVGRSLERMALAAFASGYLRDLEPFVPPRDAGWLPPEATLLICTGTQAERGSALLRMADDHHPLVRLDPGDTVVFSSKIIPGNEPEIERLHAALRARGVEVVHELDDPAVHASGHPCQGELTALYEALRPSVVVPVHGTPRHMEAHAAHARSLGLEAVEVRNGDVVHLGPGPVRHLASVGAGRIPQHAVLPG